MSVVSLAWMAIKSMSSPWEYQPWREGTSLGCPRLILFNDTDWLNCMSHISLISNWLKCFLDPPSRGNLELAPSAAKTRLQTVRMTGMDVYKKHIFCAVIIFYKYDFFWAQKCVTPVGWHLMLSVGQPPLEVNDVESVFVLGPLLKKKKIIILVLYIIIS